jgi:hypothetical protein
LKTTVTMTNVAAPKRRDTIDAVSTVQAMTGNEGGFVSATVVGRRNIDRLTHVQSSQRSREARARPTIAVAGSGEITAVEGILGLPVRQQDFASPNDAASLPDRQRPASTIPLERLAHRDNVDGEGTIRAEDLNWNGKDALQERHALWADNRARQGSSRAVSAALPRPAR